MSNKTNNIIYFIFSLFFLYLFIVYDVNFRGPDEPIYFAYTASVVEDGDLNAVNHLDSKYPYYLPSGRVGISKTYNLPDYHNHGGVILWMPFYAYAKSIYIMATRLNITGLVSHRLDKLARCALSFSTVIFGFFAVFLTHMLCKTFFSSKIAIWSTLMIFIGTPFFYYMLFEGGNANIVACLFSILSIWFCSYAINMRKSHWFLYGFFFSICVVVKVDLWFQIFFIPLFFIALLLLRKTNWINGIYFMLGFLPGFILKTVNEYIKYGTFHIGELSLLNFKDSYIYEQLFSSYRGFLYTSPILYICLLGFTFMVANLLKNIASTKEKIDDIFLMILSLSLFIKIFILGYRYAWGGGTCGARPLLTEFPIFALLYARTIKYKKRYLIYFIAVASVFFVFWNLLVVSEYMAGVDLGYVAVAGAPVLSARIKTLKIILEPLFQVKDMDLKLKLCLPLFLTFFGLALYLIKSAKSNNPLFCYVNQNGRKPLKFLSLFTTYLCVVYTVITLLNVYNNKRNVEKLRADDFFVNAKIIDSSEFEKQDNVGSMDEMIEYFKLRGNIDRVNKIKRHKKEIYSKD